MCVCVCVWGFSRVNRSPVCFVFHMRGPRCQNYRSLLILSLNSFLPHESSLRWLSWVCVDPLSHGSRDQKALSTARNFREETCRVVGSLKYSPHCAHLLIIRVAERKDISLTFATINHLNTCVLLSLSLSPRAVATKKCWILHEFAAAAASTSRMCMYV